MTIHKYFLGQSDRKIKYLYRVPQTHFYEFRYYAKSDSHAFNVCLHYVHLKLSTVAMFSNFDFKVVIEWLASYRRPLIFYEVIPLIQCLRLNAFNHVYSTVVIVMFLTTI